jgi:hypothetical protein
MPSVMKCGALAQEAQIAHRSRAPESRAECMHESKRATGFDDSSQREHGIEFEGPGEERSSKRPFQLALEVEELRSLAAKLNASAIIPPRFTRDCAFKPASFPDLQKPSGLPHSHRRQPRIRIHHDLIEDEGRRRAPLGLRCVQNEQSARRSEPDWRSSHFFGQC